MILNLDIKQTLKQINHTDIQIHKYDKQTNIQKYIQIYKPTNTHSKLACLTLNHAIFGLEII